MTENELNAMKLAMHVCRRRLAESPETARRYERASFGARVLMCFLAWRKDNKKEVDSEVARTYRDLLFGWVSLREFAYVLQAETDLENVALLKEGIALAVERETAPERIDRKPHGKNLARELLGLPETALLSRYPADCFAQAMSQGTKRYAYLVITGDTPPVNWPFHPDSHAYGEWDKVFNTGIYSDKGRW